MNSLLGDRRSFPTPFVGAAVVFLLLGCATPAPLREAEAESVASLLAYREGAEAAVDALLEAYREASRRELRLVAAADLADAAEEVSSWDADGKPTGRRMLPLDEAEGALDGYRAALDRIDAERARFAAAWDENRKNLADALELRELVRDWLAREGVQPEQIDALAEGVARAVEARGGR